MLTKADQALKEFISWNGTDEIDFYPYARDFFVNVLGYRKDWVRIGKRGQSGTPDISLSSMDSKPKDNVFWVVGEVKKEKGLFRDPDARRECWKDQLSRYVSGDTVYALLIDPITLVILRPDGTENQVVLLDKTKASELMDSTCSTNLSCLLFENSISDISLAAFKQGLSPSRFLDVTEEETRKRFYETLRTCSQDLISFSIARLKMLLRDYESYKNELTNLDAKITHKDDPAYRRVRNAIERQHAESIRMKEEILPAFQTQIGRQMPTSAKQAEQFLISVYATEGSSLVLARILLVRFFEDHELTTRKISNGGIKTFRSFYHSIKDDYRHLLSDAFKDLERRYRRLFEPSIFDWAHEGDGELSKLLLRVFYRLNAFDFVKVTGDIMGNLYERFLDVDSRKQLGEFYTPMPVAKYVLEHIGFFDKPGPLLDPACGSGTFLIAATIGLIENLKKRGISTRNAIEETVKLVHGLDINMFAAFIAQLQLIWHLFPYLKEACFNEIPEFRVFGGVNSLVFNPQGTLSSSILRDYEDVDDPSTKVRDGRYQYVIGNPPYIRNERFKDWGDWREFYHEIDHRNSDVAYYFVKRALEGGNKDREGKLPSSMPSWLLDGGSMCWVLPLGVCDSAAAAPIRERILGNRLLEIVDMEDVAHAIFPSAMASTRATTAPILLFVEKNASATKGKTRLIRMTKKCLNGDLIQMDLADQSEVQQKIFSTSPMNPYGQILTKLKNEDLPILQKLSSFSKLDIHCSSPTPMFGIKVGSSGKIFDEMKPGRFPFGKGLNIAAFHVNLNISRFVDIDMVESKSIWGHAELLERPCFAISRIVKAPHAALFDGRGLAFNDSTIIMVPNQDTRSFPWDLLLNSAVLRFVHHIVLRSGLIGVGTPVGNGKTAAWTALYARTLSAFPVPDRILMKPGKLNGYANELRELARSIASRWDRIDEGIDSAEKQALAVSDVDFAAWSTIEVIEGKPQLTNATGKWRLHFQESDQQTLGYIEGKYELLNILAYMIEAKGEPTTKDELEKMLLPRDAGPISDMIDDARNVDSPDVKRFNDLMMKSDDLIMDAFDLTEKEKEYVQVRLTSPPFDVLQPRWPWSAVASREIQEYDEDRFA